MALACGGRSGGAALLIESFHRSTEPGVRVQLIGVISEQRSDQAVPFLAALLRDRDAKMWKAGLDGLVTAASPAAVNALRAAKIRASSEQIEWLDEAINQIGDLHGPG